MRDLVYRTCNLQGQLRGGERHLRPLSPEELQSRTVLVCFKSSSRCGWRDATQIVSDQGASFSGTTPHHGCRRTRGASFCLGSNRPVSRACPALGGEPALTVWRGFDIRGSADSLPPRASWGYFQTLVTGSPRLVWPRGGEWADECVYSKAAWFEGRCRFFPSQ